MRVQVVSPWYPDNYSAYSGVFVKKQVDALTDLGHTVSVESPDLYPAPAGSVPEAVWDAMRQLAGIEVERVFRQQAESVKVPSPVPSRSGMLGRAAAFEDALRLKREFIPVIADVTHAHLGVPTGLALLELGDRPLVVTEHQSTLDRVFGQPGGTAAYRRVVEEADAFLCVSKHLRDQAVDAVGGDKVRSIEVVPNIVDLSEIPFRLRSAESTAHWIYVGTVAAHKGIELLLEAFKSYRSTDPGATLTIVGDGPHRQWVERFSAAGGLSGSLNLVGSMPHETIGRLLDEADVMVHLSPSETFGIASLEGIGAGLPVVSLRNGGAESAWGDFEECVGRLLPVDAGPEAVVSAVRALHGPGSSLDPAEGRASVESRFSPLNVGRQLEQIYEMVT